MKYQKIYTHPLYSGMLENIKSAEKDRIFCLHGIEHALDTARIAYILCLEEKLGIDKELIYAAALLHDIGRYNEENTGHDEASAAAAERIMPDCGFTPEETSQAAEAIRSHRSGSGKGLGDVLYRADKLSRNCFDCKARQECYWSEEKMNNTIKY